MKMMICTTCKDYGRPAKKKRGSDTIAIAAWFVFPFGIPYTMWRAMTKMSVCKHCGSQQLVDSESMVGMRLMAKIIGEPVEDEEPLEPPASSPPQTKSPVLDSTASPAPAAIKTVQKNKALENKDEKIQLKPTQKQKNPDVW